MDVDNIKRILIAVKNIYKRTDKTKHISKKNDEKCKISLEINERR